MRFSKTVKFSANEYPLTFHRHPLPHAKESNMNRNRFTKLAITGIALFVPLLALGCQSAQPAPTDSSKEEQEMQPEETASTEPIVEEKTIFIGPEKVECVGEGPMECFQVKEDPNGEWELFYDSIDGFEWEPGYTYELRVALHPVANPPAGGSSLQYELIEVLDKTATPFESETTALEEKIIYVGPEKADCVGVGPMECFQVKEDLNADWGYFYDEIGGFMWEPGYTYELRVAVYPVENPPADSSSLRYELIEVIDKIETPVVSQDSQSYIRIDNPTAGTLLDASKPILVSGMGAGLFEGNVVVRILDDDGQELALQPAILQSPEAGTGGEGPWEVELHIDIEAPTEGRIVAFSPSPRDGEGWTASDEVDVSLAPETAQFPNLENTPWILRAFAQVEELNSLLDVFQVSARFGPDEGRLSGQAGCNSYFTGYTLDGNLLVIDMPVGLTRMMCPEPQMALETAYLSALEAVASYEMTCNAMELRDAEDETLLVFQVDPYSQTTSFTREELANTSYLNKFAESGIAVLAGGQYREPLAADAATELVVMLTTHAVFGDVTGDQAEEALVVLVSQPGGSGSFYDLAVVRKQGQALTNMARIQLGDRVQIKSLLIEDGEIVVDMLEQGPDDPMCCPTQYTSNRYILESGELQLVRSEVIE